MGKNKSLSKKTTVKRWPKWLNPKKSLVKNMTNVCLMPESKCPVDWQLEPYYLWFCSKGNHGPWFLVLDRALAWPAQTVNKKSTKNDNSLNWIILIQMDMCLNFNTIHAYQLGPNTAE